MLLMRLGAVLAIACAAQPALCATLAPDGGRPAFGLAGKAYFRLPLDKARDARPMLGLATAVSRQDRDIAGLPRGLRRDVETVGLRLGFDGGPALTLAGTPMRGPWRETRHNVRWGTVAIVAGGLVLVAGATFAYLLHEAEKNSD
ncbi:hypothetical protein [Sphingomonas crusticola]|uniref:hypothetical protein n=1 Tax=Sphingomonas crusticola TaxID=1697973 RepID=UPI000E272FC4|nr:hypothetical protein [Sphingomonas crusticola]